MPVLPALISDGLRLALSAVLSLVVLLAGTGMHPTSHCSDHDGHAEHASVASVAVDPGEPNQDDDEGGLCLNCDCTCQTLYQAEVLAIAMPAADFGLLVRSEGPVSLLGVDLEPEPPPVRHS